MKRLWLKFKTLTQIVTEQCWISKSTERQDYDDKCWWKGFDLSSNVCEYEVNRLTNDKVITEIQNFNAKW